MFTSDETVWPPTNAMPTAMAGQPPSAVYGYPSSTGSTSSSTSSVSDGCVVDPLPLVGQIVRGIGAPKGPSEKALEAKRARRSEIERLSRQRRNDQFAGMRAEVARLEKLEASLLHAKASTSRAAMAQEDEQLIGSSSGTSTCSTSSSGSEDEQDQRLAAVRRKRRLLQDQYLATVSAVRRLRDEQSRLQNMVHEQTLLSVSLHEIAENFMEEDMVTWDDALAAWFDPLTMDDALAVMKQSCELMATLDFVGGAWQSSGAQFMGWRDKRKLIEATSTVAHGFTKQFPTRNAQQLMETTWDMFCQEWFLQKTIVSAATELKIQVMQVINDDIRIVRRRTKYKSMEHRSFHTVYMQFRIQTEDGFAVCLKTIQAPEIQRSLGENESWVDVFHWVSFRRIGGDGDASHGGGCEVSFSGTLSGGLMTFALHWLVESVLAVLRWEFVCVAPLFIMEETSSDTTTTTTTSAITGATTATQFVGEEETRHAAATL